MLNTLLIIAFVTWIATFFSQGICIYSICLIIPTLMFMGRKVDYHAKLSSIISVEVIFLILSTAWRLLFHKFILWKFVVTLIIRIIFICIIVYDDNMYVYVTEERKRK